MIDRKTGAAGSRDATVSEIPVSVVIATLGGPTLMGTIAHLNAAEVRPAEILVCVPKDAWGERPLSIVPNVRVVVLPFRGQVRQRAAGFREASQPYVLQLDDDLEFSGCTLELLLNELAELGPGHAIAPALVVRGSDGAFWKLPTGFSGLLSAAVASLLRGARWGAVRMGTISRLGHNYGVDPNAMTSRRLRVDWLPGGCVLHHRPDLVTEDYFSLPGKAYAEDLIHSHLLAEAGVQLWVTRQARCGVDREPASSPLASLVPRLRAIEFAARRRGVRPSFRAVLVLGYAMSSLVASTRAAIARAHSRLRNRAISRP